MLDFSVRLSRNNIQISEGRLSWKWIQRSVLQLLLLKQKEVELLLTLLTTTTILSLIILLEVDLSVCPESYELLKAQTTNYWSAVSASGQTILTDSTC